MLREESLQRLGAVWTAVRIIYTCGMSPLPLMALRAESRLACHGFNNVRNPNCEPRCVPQNHPHNSISHGIEGQCEPRVHIMNRGTRYKLLDAFRDTRKAYPRACEHIYCISPYRLSVQKVCVAGRGCGDHPSAVHVELCVSAASSGGGEHHELSELPRAARGSHIAPPSLYTIRSSFHRFLTYLPKVHRNRARPTRLHAQ